MSYILFVNPLILSEAGMPASDVAFATAVAAGVGTLVMGLLARYPFALAPGMGLNAYFTYGVVMEMNVPFSTALTAVFVEGLIFLALSIGGVRTAVLNAIPMSLKHATTAGIGLFLGIIGFQNARIIADDPATLVALGDLHAAPALLALGGLMLMAVLLVLRVPGALLLGILAATGAAWIVGVAPAPDRFLTVPSLPEETLFAFDFSDLWSAELAAVVLAFLFVDFFDTAGTLVGVGRLGGFLTPEGELPRADRAFSADAIGTTAGALLGTSTVTSYIESATGIEEGGRTGLTAVVVAACFLLALFFTPIIIAVPAAATAPALIAVGAVAQSMYRDEARGQRRFLLVLGGLVAFSAGGSQVGLAIGPLLPLLGDVAIPLWAVLVGGGAGLLAGSWTGAPRMIKALAQDYSSLGPRRSIAALIPSFAIAQTAVLLGVPVSFNEIIVSAIVGSGYAAGGSGVSREKMAKTVAAWILSLALAVGLGYAAFSVVDLVL